MCQGCWRPSFSTPSSSVGTWGLLLPEHSPPSATSLACFSASPGLGIQEQGLFLPSFPHSASGVEQWGARGGVGEAPCPGDREVDRNLTLAVLSWEPRLGSESLAGVAPGEL